MLRRTLLTLGATALFLAACATPTPAPLSLAEAPPIVFVHGNGDSAALWQSAIWRFESNGWPRERLVAIDVPYPLAADEDAKPQEGRSSSAQNMAYLRTEVEKVLKATGAAKVVLFANSRGGNAVRNYIQNGGGDKTVSHAILGGTPNHGVWAIKGFREGNEFSGTGPLQSAMNAPRNAAGDEVTPGVKWLTIRSDDNDKFAQPDGVWIGAKGTPTNVSYAGPELRGATNVVIARIDHRETSFSPAAFEAAYRFITGRSPQTTAIKPEGAAGGRIVLNGVLSGMGVRSDDPKSGNFANNLPLPGAQVQVYATDPDSGLRSAGAPAYSKTVGQDGLWGPFGAQAGVSYEFVIATPGYATTHIYRSGFPRSSNFLHLRAERLADSDKDAAAVVVFSRPRGYFDAQRDKMSFDGQSPPPGVPPAGAGVALSKIKLAETADRPVVADFNGERIVGRVWPARDGHLSILELNF